jgi:hypothetical protein
MSVCSGREGNDESADLIVQSKAVESAMLRRTLIFGTLAAAAAPFCPHCVAAKAASRGCRLRRAASGATEALPKILATSGVPEIDSVCEGQIGTLNALFGVKPVFGFYDDSGAPNAFAEPSRAGRKDPDGTVCLGIELAKSIHAKGTSALWIIGVMAHEWGHLFQFKQGYTEAWGVRHELTADYMAGWYLARTQADNKKLKEEISSLFETLGDSAFADPNHHGTPKQRSRLLLWAAGEVKIVDEKYEEAASTAKDAFAAALRRLVEY